MVDNLNVRNQHHKKQVFLKNNVLWVEQVYLAKYDITPSHFTILEDDIDQFRQAHHEKCNPPVTNAGNERNR
jgi:hypothetical protein